MYMQIRLPLACLLIVCYCFWYYSRKRRLNTKASRVFTLLGIDTMINLLAATITEYTVNNRDLVSPLVNDVWHIIFLVSITFWCGLMLIYVLLLIERDGGGSQRKGKIVIAVLCVIGAILQIVLPIEYIDTEFGSYSLGPKAYALYVVVSYVLIMLPWKAIRYRSLLGKSKSNVLIASALIYVAMALVQMIWPHILLTSLAATMIILGLMVNMEDSNLYISSKTGLYNHFAFRKIAQEKLNDRRPLNVVLYVFQGSENAIDNAIYAIDAKVEKSDTGLICCLLRHNALAIVPMSRLGKITALPPYLNTFQFDDRNLRYRSEVFHFDAGTNFDQVQSTLRSAYTLFEDEGQKLDDLTQLLRRDAFADQVEGMLDRDESLALLMIDLDDFKIVNDTYGHGVGDEVLRGVAGVLRDEIRGTDLACRMGGDEFAIVLTGRPGEANVQLIVERIMERVRELALLPDNTMRIEISVGVREFDPCEESIDFKTLYDEADKAMYRAKRSGKNKIVFYEER